MAKFEKTLSGDFETIAYNIENYLINDESIRLVDKVSMKNGSTNCSTMVFDIYNKYLENKMGLTITLFEYSNICIRCVAIASGFKDVKGEEFGDVELYDRLDKILEICKKITLKDT